MTTLLDVPRALLARGYDIGKTGADGDLGPSTLGAMLKVLKKVPVILAPAPVPSMPAGVVPSDWMPWAEMQRIVVHWTAGSNTASVLDKEHYHILIEGSGKVVRGKPSIDLNQAPVKKGYAAHTLNCNSGSIGVSLCGMAGAVESPFSAGNSPITRAQWEALPNVLADLCRRYSIPVTPSTVLSHAEVQATLGITQRGKWDIARLPFEPSVKGAKAVGDLFRAATKIRL
ncbi:peptidoglycan recognition family protein [Mesorhizobium sp. DCY119]|uniref:peptidoglycan recognition protein family protein n=1 Tax=Mesorhizobium sp. DCY119 TaxID=2108445 RepID=UPI000E763619|nr:peptidoglycan recognition family protein [Mesorhizobium sp. DCY119]RJG40872.1 N-acetylmuramoyl-L-alanine amidase [Mesorhizobium sp. DCY119]